MDAKPQTRRTVILAGFALLLLLMIACASGSGKNSVDLPNNVTAEADGNRKVTVKWESVLIKRDLIGYVVYWGPDAALDEKNASSAEVSAETLAYVTDSLPSGKWYVGVRGKFLRTYSGINTSQEIQLGPLSDPVEIQIP